MSDRILKINEFLKEQVARIVREEIEFEQGTIITIISASASPDLRYAKIYISVLPDGQADFVLKRLNHSVKSIQKSLGENVSFKFTPKLKFVLDDIERKAADIDNLLDNLKY